MPEGFSLGSLFRLSEGVGGVAACFIKGEISHTYSSDCYPIDPNSVDAVR